MAAAAGPRAPGRRCRVPALLMPPRRGTGGPAHQPIVHDFFDLRYTNRKAGAGFYKEGAVVGAGRGVVSCGPGSRLGARGRGMVPIRIPRRALGRDTRGVARGEMVSCPGRVERKRNETRVQRKKREAQLRCNGR